MDLNLVKILIPVSVSASMYLLMKTYTTYADECRKYNKDLLLSKIFNIDRINEFLASFTPGNSQSQENINVQFEVGADNSDLVAALERIRQRTAQTDNASD